MNVKKLNEEIIQYEALKNIEEVCIDTSKKAEQRLMQFLEEIENPYYFLCGNVPVRICFLDEGIDLRKRLLNYFTGLK